MKRIIFIGDSITDCDRQYHKRESLGNGYVSMIREKLSTDNYEIINKGISGNKLVDVINRLNQDCIELKPDVVSILVGINDVWHFMRGGTYDIKAEMNHFRQAYSELIETLHKAMIHNIRIMEPFVLPIPEDRNNWRVDLDQRIQIIRQLAKKYHCQFIALDGIMNEAGINDRFEQYAYDGVHPTKEGHEIIAKAWLKGFEE